MDWLEIVVSGVVGLVLGAALNEVTARRNGRRAEQGRHQEVARQRLADTIRRYRAQVSTALLPSTPRDAMAPDPYAFESRLTFAREVEIELEHMDGKTATKMRGYLEQALGPLTAGAGRRLANIPADQHTATMQAEALWYVGDGLRDPQIHDTGLVGQASQARKSPKDEIDARDAAAGLLGEMLRSLEQRR